MGRSDPRLVSKPHRVFWCGFETTTIKLQQAGWEIAAEQVHGMMTIQLVMRHQEAGCIAITNPVEYWQMAEIEIARHSPLGAYPLQNDPRLLTFHVVRMAHKLQMERLMNARITEHVPSFHQIDAMPQFVNTEVRNLEDFCVFATPLVRTEELIVDPDEVGMLLEKLKQAQLPEQEAIRKRKQLRESREGFQLGGEPSMKFHAQILSIAA